MIVCSDDRRLTRLLEEELNGEEFTSLVAHVESCPACQERLRTLTSDGSLVRMGEAWDDDQGTLSTDASMNSDSSSDRVAHRISMQHPTHWASQTLVNSDDLAPGFPDVDGYDILCEARARRHGGGLQGPPTGFNRLVALKMIRAGSLASRRRARFRIEAEAVARLQHPNIVQIHEIGEDGRPALLRPGVARGRQPRRPAGAARPSRGRPAAELVETLARAMSTPPTGRHRPPRPQAGQRPARRRTAAPRSPTSAWPSSWIGRPARPRPAQIMGTPSYMAPEQARGAQGRRARRPTSTPWGRSSTRCSPAGRRSRATTPLETRRCRSSTTSRCRPSRLQPAGRPRPGDDLPEVPGEGTAPALRQRRGAGRRPGSLPRRRADPGAGHAAVGAWAQVGPAGQPCPA